MTPANITEATMTQTHSGPTSYEIKAHDPQMQAAFGDLREAFEAFREANDQRLGEIETRAAPDVLIEEKLGRIEASLDQASRRLDRLALEGRRPPLAGTDRREPDSRTLAHKAAFDAYVRGGETAGLAALEAKALSAGSGPDGGYLAPHEVERAVLTRLAAISPMRALATVRTTSAGTYRVACSPTGPASGWSAEVAARPETASPTLSELTFPAMELYAMPAATRTLLDDAVVDIDAWIAEEVETTFAEQESTAFITGSGTDRPRGVLTTPFVADASWTWGNLGVINTGVAGAFPAANPSDLLIDLVYRLRAGYRQNGAFLMNRTTQAVIRKFRDSTGNYLWQPPSAIGQPATLLNFPVAEAEAMPAIANNAVSVLFGDFRRGYLIVDRMGLRILRDPYSAKPYVLFYITKRVGGGVQDFAAIKGLRFAA